MMLQFHILHMCGSFLLDSNDNITEQSIFTFLKVQEAHTIVTNNSIARLLSETSWYCARSVDINSAAVIKHYDRNLWFYHWLRCWFCLFVRSHIWSVQMAIVSPWDATTVINACHLQSAHISITWCRNDVLVMYVRTGHKITFFNFVVILKGR